ncbi:MAG TPA: NUDIX hydrolase [Patescibacteria group bacterium]
MTPKKWTLLSKKDISPHKWFPLEFRTYKLPDGKIVKDFSVTTLEDVSMVVPITKDKKVVLVRQFKPGVDEVILEFPAGRIEPHHKDLLSLAQDELEEEVGIKVEKSKLQYFGVVAGFVSKGSEKVYLYLASDVEFNSKQNLDITEDIEIVTLTFNEMEDYIFNGKIWASQTVAAWEIAKKHFPEIFK